MKSLTLLISAGRQFIDRYKNYSSSSSDKQSIFEADRLRHFLDSVYNSKKLGSVGVALAGDLDSKIIKKDLGKIISDYPDLSWDGEGSLHPIINEKKSIIDRLIWV